MLIIPPEGAPMMGGRAIVPPGHTSSPNDSSIIVETSKPRRIANTQYASLGTFDPHAHRRMISAAMGTERSAMSPRYNCHGMTFASRRTNIDETDEVWKIIEDDTFAAIDLRQVLPGDIVLYIGEGGDVSHSASVVQAARFEQSGHLLEYPIVVGKWGRGREVIHRANLSPYGHNMRYYRCNP